MKKYVDFSGRARRLEYWTFTLWNLIFALVAIVLDNLFGNADPELGYGLIYSLFSLAILLPTWAVTVRRLHDVGKSGWWVATDKLDTHPWCSLSIDFCPYK